MIAPVSQASEATLDDVVLDVRDLTVEFPLRTGVVTAVDQVGFTVRRGETVCIVGESGSGKSVTARSILQIVDKPGRIVSGRILYHRHRSGRHAGAAPADAAPIDLARLAPKGPAIRAIRGDDIAMIFQEPMSSLSPVHTIGDQIAESLILHRGLRKKQARAETVELLRQVEIPKPELAVDRYPFEYSGGMRQRAMIAMALACRPGILIADEPTTALDVTTQAEILRLIRSLQDRHGMAVIFITHDMGVVAQIAHRVVVMRQGRVEETGATADIFHRPQADYTRMLLGSVIKLERPAEAKVSVPPAATAGGGPLLQVDDLSLHFPVRKGLLNRVVDVVKAVDGVSLDLKDGETLGIVGESGSGKTSLGRMIMSVYRANGGQIRYRRTDGDRVDLLSLDKAALKPIRREIRMIFQDPYASLNPRMTVAQIVGEPLVIHQVAKGSEVTDRVAHLLREVGLSPEMMERYPHAFSGGQRQRIGIARALALNPRIIVADEATSALDVSIRVQVLDLLLRLQAEHGLSFVFISHDISVIRYFCDRVAVMHRGRVVELDDASRVCNAPTHPYTQSLIAAVPRPDPGRRGARA